MQLNPRYGSDPVIVIDGDPASVAEPAVRQRRRLLDVVSAFTAEQWAHPSRCAGWTNRDVVVHLDGTNQFWAMSIDAGLRGDPTRFLATFDPVATPAQLVADAGDRPVADVLARFRDSTVALAAQIDALSSEQWTVVAEAPPGHLRMCEVVHHALWDSWIHERDVLAPMGVASTVGADEVAACLRYAAALGPAFAVAEVDGLEATFAVAASAPDVTLRVHAADRVTVTPGAHGCDLELTGDAVQLVDALSVRGPFPVAPPEDVLRVLGGLATVFDADGPA